MKPQSALAAAAVGLSSTVAAYGGKGVSYAGVNLAGCDFQCDVQGSCTGGENAQYFCPKPEQYKSQIAHFTKKWKHNIFRLPVGWQYITGGKSDGPLGGKVWDNYQGMLKECLASGSKCIIDIHNYGKFSGTNLSGKTSKDLASLWTQIAKKYADEPNVVFGVMNEPHDQDGKAWQETCQGAVDAIRQAGAKDQWILIPGPPWNHLTDFAETTSKYSYAIKDKADSSGKNLIMDLHQYFDTDGSGTHTECAPWSKVESGFKSAAASLEKAGRKAFVSETGGGNTKSCEETVGAAFDFLNEHSDAFLGWAGWSAGAFKDDYELVETPQGDKDRSIVESCIGGKFKNPGTKTTPKPKPSPKSSPKPKHSPSPYHAKSSPSPAPYHPPNSSPSPSPYRVNSPLPGGSPAPGGGYNPPKKPKKKCKKKAGHSSTFATVPRYSPTPSPSPAPYNYPPKSPVPYKQPKPKHSHPKQKPDSYSQKPKNQGGSQKYDSGSSEKKQEGKKYNKRNAFPFTFRFF